VPLSSAPTPTSPSPAARGLLAIVGFYQRLTAHRVSACRFYPSCSQYCSEAIAVHGALKGLGLSMRRISRCRPLGPHGVDLVPLHKKERK
jgi:putative membrane protein insertion efficiency factor